MSQQVRLFGTPLSNYYNKVKIALIELQIPFVEVLHLPGDHWPDRGSPSGKIPFLKTQDGFVYESQAILEYLEETTPESKTCYPVTALEKARCRELIHTIELYIELPARRLYPAAFWGNALNDSLAQNVLTKIKLGLRTLSRRTLFNSWLCGKTFTYAHAAAWAHLSTVRNALRALKQPDLVSEIVPQANTYLEHVLTRPSVKRVANDLRQAWHNRTESNNS